MNSKARKAAKTAAWIVGALVAVVFVLLLALGPVIKGSAQTVAPLVLGTDVSISNVTANAFAGRLDIGGMTVGAPEGFDANIFELDTFRFDIDTASILKASEPIHIREITIENPLVTYELKGIHDNLHKLLDNLGASKDEDEKDSGSEGGKKKKGRGVVIDKFTFKGGHVRVAVASGKGAVVPLPTIELSDIGKDCGGVTAVKATFEIIESIVVGTLKAVVGVVGDVGELAVDGVAAVGGLAVDGVTAVGGAAVDGVKAIGGAIGSLFGGSKDEDEKPADEKEKPADEEAADGETAAPEAEEK